MARLSTGVERLRRGFDDFFGGPAETISPTTKPRTGFNLGRLAHIEHGAPRIEVREVDEADSVFGCSWVETGRTLHLLGGFIRLPLWTRIQDIKQYQLIKTPDNLPY